MYVAGRKNTVIRRNFTQGNALSTASNCWFSLDRRHSVSRAALGLLTLFITPPHEFLSTYSTPNAVLKGFKAVCFFTAGPSFGENPNLVTVTQSLTVGPGHLWNYLCGRRQINKQNRSRNNLFLLLTRPKRSLRNCSIKQCHQGRSRLRAIAPQFFWHRQM